MLKHEEKKRNRMRRGSIAYDPQQMLYHPNPQLNQYETSPSRISSVFSQILVKHYLETSPSEEEQVTEDEYWWNSKRTARKKFVLPWNHPLTVSKPHSPGRVKGSPILKSEKGSIVQAIPQETETLLEPSYTFVRRRKRCCCCMLRQKEDEELPDMSLESSLPIPDLPSPSQLVSIRRREVNPSLVPDILERTPSQLSEDRGMGSFIEDLKRSQAHSVSSLSWKTDSSVH